MSDARTPRLIRPASLIPLPFSMVLNPLAFVLHPLSFPSGSEKPESQSHKQIGNGRRLEQQPRAHSQQRQGGAKSRDEPSPIGLAKPEHY